MTTRAKALFPALIALALAAPLAAQETDPTLSMGAEATPQKEVLKTPETAGIGELYLSATHGDWELRCIKAEDGSDPCRLYQLLRSADGNPTAEISLFNLPASGQAVAGAAILVPLDTLLSANLTIAIDENPPMLYPYTVCGHEGCIARVGFSAEQIEQMKSGKAGVLTIIPAGAPDTQVPLAISLSGFTAGYEAVSAANAGGN